MIDPALHVNEKSSVHVPNIIGKVMGAENGEMGAGGVWRMACEGGGRRQGG